MMEHDAGALAPDSRAPEPPDAAGSVPDPSDAGRAAVCWAEGGELPDWIDAPATPAERLHDDLLAAELDALVRAVGRYARGAAPIYAGNLAARDNTAALDWRDRPDIVMAEGPVVARLTSSDPEAVEPIGSDALVLYVFSPAQRRKVALLEYPGAAGTTQIGPIHPYGTYGGNRASCAGCVTPFLDGPDAIAIDVRDASGEGGIVVSAEGSLVRVPPNEITWEQILAVNETPGGVSPRAVELFVLRADERVRTVTQSLSVPADDVLAAVGPPYFSCERRVEYSAEHWIDRVCLGDYGVRDFEITSLETICCRCPGDAPVCSHAECEPVPGF